MTADLMSTGARASTSAIDGAGFETFVDVMRASALHDRAAGIRFYTSQNESLRLSYAELDAAARVDAARLVGLGYGPGDVAVLLFDPGFSFIRAVYAAFYAGIAIAPVPVPSARDPRIGIVRLAAIVADSGSRLLLSEVSALPDVDAMQSGLGDIQILMLDSPADTTAEPQPWTPPAITRDSLALLQYTSGSTGVPKGVIVSHANLLANQSSISQAIGVTSESVVVGWLPHYHDMGLIGLMLQPIFSAAEVVLTSPSQFLRRPILWLRLISEYRATLTVGPDFAYALCTRMVTDEQLAELDLSSLRINITGAEPVRIRTIRDFSEKFAPAGYSAAAWLPAYGMAETTLLVTAFAVADEPRVIRADASALELGHVESVLSAAAPGGREVELVSCGRPTAGHAVRIVDPVTRLALAEGEIGEIWVSGPSVTGGYWQRPDATGEVFGVRLADEDGDDTDGTGHDDAAGTGYLRTGDLGATIDGELYITGRIKDLIIVRGRNISPTDIESSVAELFEGRSSALSAAFETGADDDVAVVIELDPAFLRDAQLDAVATEVRKRLTDEFALPKLGVAFIRKGVLPRTTSGKVQRSLTRAMLRSGALTTAHTDGVAALDPKEN